MDRPLAIFAGIWTPGWRGARTLREGEVEAGFLTREVNAEVGAVHPEAIPMILTERVELDTWLRARALLRPLSERRDSPDPIREWQARLTRDRHYVSSGLSEYINRQAYFALTLGRCP